MAFKDQLQTKIRVDHLANQALASLDKSDGTGKLDKAALRLLLDLAGYQLRSARDLEVYSREFEADPPEILVLDRELKFFNTTLDDVALRKAATLKEMLSLSNMIKILNDKPVISRQGADSVNHLRRHILDGLDLTYTPEDIRDIAEDGQLGLASENFSQAETVLNMFAELLGLVRLPSPRPGILLWARPDSRTDREPAYNPVVLADRADNTVKLFTSSLTGSYLKKPESLPEILSGQPDPTAENEPVFSSLARLVQEAGTDRIPI
ncbi:MAG: hypothetical protein R6U29_00560 [Desulfosudaceae bacterium]